MMCAFMTPVVKNDWEIYNINNNNNKSSKNNSGANTQQVANSALQLQMRKRAAQRRRDLLVQRSLSYSSSPQRMQSGDLIPRRAYHLSTSSSASASRASIHPQVGKPARHSPPPPPKHDSSSLADQSSASLNKFHKRVVEKLKMALHIKDDRHKDDSEEEGAEDKRP